jgi:predicted esterase
VPLWEGVECEAPAANTAVRAYFEVPGAAGAEEDDFFRLPFPNDIRLNDGKPDLSGFPTPGPELLGVDIVQRYVDRLEAGGDHFSGNGSVVFRFSGPVDYSTFDFEGDNRPVVLVDLTARDDDGHVEPIGRQGVEWAAGGSKTKYVCQDWLSVRPGLGGVLQPNHTYAVWISSDAKDKDGNDIERAPNFEAMLKAAPPADAKLAAAHALYAPLRTYLAEYFEDGEAKPIDPDTLVNASVFTVGDTVKPMADLAEAVDAWASPAPPAMSPLEASDWVKCGGNAKSPCPQAEGGRACGNGTADYDEYQALVTLPVFQKGEAPYLESGGDIDASGPVRTEEVCMAVSVPKGSAPAAGWPLVIYAHGTGGSFRSHLVPEVAEELAKASPKFAVLGIDQVQHGPRRGDSTEEPDDLFFNFANPDAARGNPLQGAADQLSLLQLAKSLGTVTVGSNSFSIDPAHVVFYGHSQGSTHGSLMLPYSDFPGAVLSGNGGSLTHALLAKTNPVNIAGALPIALQDVVLDQSGNPVLPMGAGHPVLSLLQQWIDPGDPLNLAPLALKRPALGQTPKHVFETFGLGDTYSPPKTLTAYSVAAGLGLAESPEGVNPTGDNKTGLTPEAQIQGNFTLASVDYTGAVRQYAPPTGTDGHFVAFDVPEAQADVVSFLEALGTGAVPSVP